MDVDVVLMTLQNAREVMNVMHRIFARQKFVTVGQLYELVDLPTNHQHELFGWTDLKTVRIVLVKDGYQLTLPTAEELR